MDSYITGRIIRELREGMGMTQAELASKLFVSDKTVSKWETGKGCPDVALLEPIAMAFGVSVAELLEGRAVSNANRSANMLRSKFCICPVCANVIHSMGEAVISCHGITLAPEKEKAADAQHSLSVEIVEDEYYVRILHGMEKEHHISFVAALSQDRIQLVKLYPEGDAAAGFKMNGVRRIVFCCSRDGLFAYELHGGRQRSGQ